MDNMLIVLRAFEYEMVLVDYALKLAPNLIQIDTVKLETVLC